MKKHTTMLVGALIATAFVIATVGGASAQAPRKAPGGKIAFVDLLEFMQKSKKVQARQKNMIDFQNKKKSELMNLQKKIKDLQQELQSQGPMLKEERRKAKERELQHLVIDIRTMEKQAKADLERESRENQRIIMQGVQKIVTDLRSKGGFAFIFNQAAILSADDAYDITAEVIKRYDAAPEASAAAAPKPAAPKPATKKR